MKRGSLVPALALLAGLGPGCAGMMTAPTPFPPPGALRQAGRRAPDDPTVRGARLVPESLAEARGWGVEPSGGVRAIVAGVRVISWPTGSIVAAADRLPATPATVVALPERLGGGFLMAVGVHLWRAEAWLDPARPVYTSRSPIAEILVGLDRVYARSGQGALAALDPRTGQPLELGPLPASPQVGRLAALDAWHALAVADFRGVVVTSDAGSSWRPVALPIEPDDVLALDAGFVVGGLDRGRRTQWWEVRPEGQTGWLPLPPSSGPALAQPPVGLDAAARIFGPRPLAAAIEDGWPLTDGTVLLARDGALARVRLSDGALVELVADAFPLKPARCHPVSLPRPSDRGGLAFVCGEPLGRTLLFRWDALRSRLAELRRFDGPRQVLGFGNGALAVRGSCAPRTTAESGDSDRAWCLMLPGDDWSEVHFRGEDIDRARLVVLTDGRVAFIRPPLGGDLSTARLTLVDRGRAVHLPLQVAPLRIDVVHALSWGIWMDGFEERRPGVIGGWVDAAGSALGVEIAMDGQVRVGEYIRDAGAPIVSGRWAFGWTASRRGFETTDGGMTWTKEIALPDPIAETAAFRERACGPAGCIMAGWLRVGWGLPAEQPAPQAPPPPPAWTRRPSTPLRLDCEVLGRRPSEPPRPIPSAARLNRGGLSSSPWASTPVLPSFAGRPGPVTGADDSRLTVEASNAVDRPVRPMPLARVYAWGPGSGAWDQVGRWLVRWQSPWGGWTEVRSSSASAAPWSNLESARRALGQGLGAPVGWTLAPGDDAEHALLIARHTMGAPSAEVWALTTDQAPVAVQRPGGDAIPDIEGAVRIGGRWVLATVQPASELAATVVWVLDGSAPREVGRVPRAGFVARPWVRLARRGDGRAVGLVAEGQTGSEHGPFFWITSVDLETGDVGDPEPLAPLDLSDRSVAPCAGDDGGWEIELPYPGAIEVRVGPFGSSVLQSTLARMKVSRTHACIEYLLSSADPSESAAFDASLHAPASPPSQPSVRTIDVSVLSSGTRIPLRCSVR